MSRKYSKMLLQNCVILLCLLLISIDFSRASSPHHANNHRWLRTEIMDGNGLYILEWKILAKDIHFQVTANTRGFIGLGFSRKTGKISDSDIILAWVDDRTGKPNALVSV